MTEKVPMTAEGHAALEAELKYLRTVERQRIIKAISQKLGPTATFPRMLSIMRRKKPRV